MEQDADFKTASAFRLIALGPSHDPSAVPLNIAFISASESFNKPRTSTNSGSAPSSV
jgi:hypothetical protein